MPITMASRHPVSPPASLLSCWVLSCAHHLSVWAPEQVGKHPLHHPKSWQRFLRWVFGVKKGTFWITHQTRSQPGDLPWAQQLDDAKCLDVVLFIGNSGALWAMTDCDCRVTGGYSWGGNSPVSNRKVVLGTSYSCFFQGSGGIFLLSSSFPIPSSPAALGFSASGSFLLVCHFLGEGVPWCLAACCIFGSAVDALHH